jgi:hypothetical protein
LESLSVLYNNYEKDDRVALLTATCRLAKVKDFKKAGFIFQGDYDFDYARRRNKSESFIPAYMDKGIISLREKQAQSEREFLCQTLKWALGESSLFQHSNIPLLKKSII